MKKLKLRILLPAIIFIASILCNLPLLSQTADNQISMKYKYPEDRSVTYKQTSKILQNMDIEGQQMQNVINTLFGCSVKSAGGSGTDLALEVRIDTVAQSVESPMGGSGGGVSGLSGKTFRMVISPSGKEIDLSGAAKVAFHAASSGTTNLANNMMDFFPDLPVAMVKQGDKWNAVDSINASSESTSMRLLTNSENTFEGIEKVNGYDCIKISSNVSGTQTIKTLSQDMNVKVTGPYTGKYTTWFSVEEGYFIKTSSEALLKGTIEISEMAMTMPLTMTVSTTTDLVE